VSFSDAKIPAEGFEAMAEGACRHGGVLGHFKELGVTDVVRILELAK